MMFFRTIFAILIAPFVWLANLFKHQGNDLEWHFIYSLSFVNIETRYKRQFLADDLLIASYILFLARYFYICDERQIDIVRDCLLGAIKEASEPWQLGGKLCEAVFHTLNEQEQNAVMKLFGSLFGSMPPIFHSEEKEIKDPFARYSFLVFMRNGKLTSTFHMSLGGDIILLPITVGVLYSYVINKLRAKDKKKKLDQSILDLLKALANIDCRSLDGLHKLPVEIISKNNLNY